MYRRRKRLRLEGFDYTRPGAYFVTIVTQGRRQIFGRIAAGEVELSPAGEMVERVWRELPLRYDGVDIGEFVVMPDHVHGIVIIDPARRAVCRASGAHAASDCSPTGNGDAARAILIDGGTSAPAGAAAGGRPCTGFRCGGSIPDAVMGDRAPRSDPTDAAGHAVHDHNHGPHRARAGCIYDPGEASRTSGSEPREPAHRNAAGRPRGAAPADIANPENPSSGPAPAGHLRPCIRSLPDAIHRFKSFTTSEYRRGMRAHGWPTIGRRLWLRSYWDDIMPCHDVPAIAEYIRTNPRLSQERGKQESD